MKIPPNSAAQNLLSKDDPSPVGFINHNSGHPLLLVCEHAGQAIPKKLGDLGLTMDQLNSHIGWDIGAEAVTRAMALALGAPAVIQRYNRLVIDCNRPPDAPDAMPEISDHIEIPGNIALGPTARRTRTREIFEPFHAAVTEFIEQHPRRIILSIHSFTPSMDDIYRPWDLGFLFRKDTETSQLLRHFVNDSQPGLTIGMNQPYQIDDASDWFVPRHGEAHGLPHSLIEIRNDHIRDAKGQAHWAQTLVAATQKYLEEV